MFLSLSYRRSFPLCPSDTFSYPVCPSSDFFILRAHPYMKNYFHLYGRRSISSAQEGNSETSVPWTTFQPHRQNYFTASKVLDSVRSVHISVLHNLLTEADPLAFQRDNLLIYLRLSTPHASWYHRRHSIYIHRRFLSQPLRL